MHFRTDWYVLLDEHITYTFLIVDSYDDVLFLFILVFPSSDKEAPMPTLVTFVAFLPQFQCPFSRNSIPKGPDLWMRQMRKVLTHPARI